MLLLQLLQTQFDCKGLLIEGLETAVIMILLVQ
nr:MAG TPA: hypothetical protein [Caudoviricetes sp.]